MNELTRADLFARLPYRMAEDLAEHLGSDPAFVDDMVRQYEEADERGKQDIADFHDSDGPEKVEEANEYAERPESEETK